MAAYFKTDAAAYIVDELAQYYRDRNMAAVTFTVDVKFDPSSQGFFPDDRAAYRINSASRRSHEPQAYIHLSGWSPKYFPPILVQYANILLKDKDPVLHRLPHAHPRPLARRPRPHRHPRRDQAHPLQTPRHPPPRPARLRRARFSPVTACSGLPRSVRMAVVGG